GAVEGRQAAEGGAAAQQAADHRQATAEDVAAEEGAGDAGHGADQTASQEVAAQEVAAQGAAEQVTAQQGTEQVAVARTAGQDREVDAAGAARSAEETGGGGGSEADGAEGEHGGDAEGAPGGLEHGVYSSGSGSGGAGVRGGEPAGCAEARGTFAQHPPIRPRELCTLCRPPARRQLCQKHGIGGPHPVSGPGATSFAGRCRPTAGTPAGPTRRRRSPRRAGG